MAAVIFSCPSFDTPDDRRAVPFFLVSPPAPCCSAKMQSKFREWGDFRVFLAVMREGSTLAASRGLGINQTTVSRRIDVLENALGVTFFEKSTRGACPTGSRS